MIKGKISWLLRFLLELRTLWCAPSLVGAQPLSCPTIVSPEELDSRVGYAFKAGSGCWAHAIAWHTVYLKHIPIWTTLLSRDCGHSQHGSSKEAPLGIWPKQSQSCWWWSKNFNWFCQHTHPQHSEGLSVGLHVQNVAPGACWHCTLLAHSPPGTRAWTGPWCSGPTWHQLPTSSQGETIDEKAERPDRICRDQSLQGHHWVCYHASRDMQPSLTIRTTGRGMLLSNLPGTENKITRGG